MQILAFDSLQGLKILEAAGVVHNNMQSESLIWVKEGVEQKRPCAKIVDFGWKQDSTGSDWNLAEEGKRLMGNWSPELILKLPTTHVSDVWGLAVTLCELHSGRCMSRDARDTSTILAQSLGLCNLRQGLPRDFLKQSRADIRSFVSPGVRHLPVSQRSLEVLEPKQWGLNQILGKNWEESDKSKLGQLLQKALVMSPNERPTAAVLLDKCSFVKATITGKLQTPGIYR